MRNGILMASGGPSRSTSFGETNYPKTISVFVAERRLLCTQKGTRSRRWHRSRNTTTPPTRRSGNTTTALTATQATGCNAARHVATVAMLGRLKRKDERTRERRRRARRRKTEHAGDGHPGDWLQRGDVLAGYLTREALAKEFGISERTLMRWELMRTGPPPTRLGRDVLYHIASVRDSVAARETKMVRARRAREVA